MLAFETRMVKFTSNVLGMIEGRNENKKYIYINARLFYTNKEIIMIP